MRKDGEIGRRRRRMGKRRREETEKDREKKRDFKVFSLFPDAD